MTIQEMRDALGLGPNVSDEDVIAAYGASLLAAQASPLTLEDAKAHLRVDGDDEDDLIDGCIAAAVDHVERFTGLVLTRRLVTETLWNWGDRLNSWPVRGIVSVSYVDALYLEQDYDLTALRVNLAARPVRLGTNVRWPLVYGHNAPITVVVDAGYLTSAEVPASVMQAIKLLVGHFFRNREAASVGVTVTEVPMAVDSLLRSHRLVGL
jgi:uncharacterized phiE125 gp8 family phage protein